MTNEETMPTQIPFTRKHKKPIIKIIIGIILIGFLGTGISLAARIWDPLWNPFRPSPENVINKMTSKIGQLKNVHSEVKLDVEIKEEDSTAEGIKIFMGFNSDLDNIEPENIKSAGNFDIVLSLDGMQISLAGENRIIGQDFYFKLTTVPSIPIFQMMGIDFSKLKNQWIKSGEEINQDKEITGRFEALFKDKNFYIVKEELPDEEINKVKTHHYLISLNEEEIKKTLPELLDILLPAGQLTEINRENLVSGFSEFLEKIGEISAEIWIGKKDFYLYKIKAEKEIDLSDFDAANKNKVDLKVEINFSKFNQPVKIEAPENFKKLEEIYQPSIYFGGGNTPL